MILKNKSYFVSIVVGHYCYPAIELNLVNR